MRAVTTSVRSRKARDKASRKRTEDGLSAYGFCTLLHDLGTFAGNNLKVEKNQYALVLKSPSRTAVTDIPTVGVKP